MSNVFDAYTSYGDIIDDVTAGQYTQFYVKRQIGGIFPDVVTEELHRDTLTTTKHPIEIGSPVTDHSYFQNPTVEVRGGFSNSSAGSVGWVQAAYNMLIALQQTRQTFDISTGKRYYTDMLMTNLMVLTTDDSENSLMFTCSFEHEFFVQTQSTGSAQSGGVTDGSTPAGISDTNAAAAGLVSDSSGNVSFPNGVAPGGNYQLQGVTPPSFGQNPTSIFGP